MNKQKIAIGGLIVAATLALSGCGPNLGEKIMEKTIESQTGGKVDINSNRGEVTIDSEQGNLTVSGDGTATLIKDFPKDIYIAPDAKILLSLANGQDKSYSVVYTTGISMDDVYATYREDLAAKGWASDSEEVVVISETKMLIYKKGVQRLTIMISLSQDEKFAGKTHVQVIGAEDKSTN
jgi:hypothetical protein